MSRIVPARGRAHPPDRASRSLSVRRLRGAARSPLGRRALARRGGAWALATAVALLVTLTVSDAHRTRRSWGTTSPVVVMARTVSSGEELTDADTELRRWPVGLIPPGALRERPSGQRLAATAHAGEVLVEPRLARSRVGSAAAVLPDGSAAIAVPLGAAPPPLSTGDRVDVLAMVANDPWAAGGPGTVDAVARGAEVIDLGEGHATIVVTRDEVEPTVAAVLSGNLTLVLTG